VANNPSHGSVSVSTNGGFTYTPTSSYVGADSFTFTLTDRYGFVSQPATVTLNVTRLPPSISGFSPPSGPPGTSVIISGSNLSGALSVTLNGKAVPVNSDTATSVNCTVPVGATSGRLAVTTAGGTATTATNFTVTAAQPPTVKSFSPTSGKVGTSVAISGTNLYGTTSVTVNGTPAPILGDTNTFVTITIPTGATKGKIAVTTAAGTATSKKTFRVKKR
jgi:hypothetical protein